MIRVELDEEIKRRGIFEYRVPSMQIVGRSRQPLLDACRDVCAILGDTCQEEMALYRQNSETPSLTCIASVGARLRVVEESAGGIHFGKWRPFDRGEMLEAAE